MAYNKKNNLLIQYNIILNLKTQFVCYIIMILLYSSITDCQATDGTILLNNQMPAKAVSAIATHSVVLNPGFHAVGSAGAFDAKIGTINSVYPLIQVATGSTALQSPKDNEYGSATKNYVRTTIPLISTTDATQFSGDNSLITEVYSDGLGQNNMTLQKGITPGKKDLATIANYDCLGELTNQWLPTPMEGISTTDPGMVIQQAQNFYADTPYTTIAPLITEAIDGISVCKPGVAWHAGLKIQKKELLASDPTNPELFIRQYSAVDNKVVLTDDPNNFFSVAVLKTSDEDGHVSYNFTDAWGRTLLERKINNGEYLDTYSVYDDMGHLRFVLSPEASDLMAVATIYSFGTDIKTDNGPLALFAYAYKYDERGRCIAKKLPGKDWTNMMYDMADHLAFSQDGNQHIISQWTYYKYDVLDRLIQSGTTTLTLSDVSTMQTTCSNTTDVETYQPGAGYTSNFPTGTNPVLLTQNFYDSYDYLTIPAYASISPTLTYDAATTGFDAKYSNVVNGVDIGTKGMLTGTTVALLDNSMTLFNAMYYDDHGRVVQTRANNHLNGYDNEYFHYNFAGQVLNKRHVHNTPYISLPLTENYRLQYDNASRLISIHHALNTQKEVLMDSLAYDETGRVIKKILHGGIQTINYAYNIQNSLKSISSEKFNEILYYQDSPIATPCFNGNISSLTFGTGLDKTCVYSYDQINRLMSGNAGSNPSFSEAVGSYDKNGNIQSLKRNGYVYDYGHNVVQGPIDDLTMSYNGNQLTSVSDAVDQSTVITTNDFEDKQDATIPAEYLYDANGNQTADLNKGIALIHYNLLNLPQKVQFQNGTKNEYLYDAIGVKQRASYNYSTATSLIPLGNTDPTRENNAPSTFQTDYCGNYVYEKSGTGNIELKRILTPEGYVSTYAGLISSLGNWTYTYLLKDHQGNTRVNLTSDYISNNTSKASTASDQIDYYPFGMERSNTGQTSGGVFNSGTNPYLYSGKETERMNGLNEYDFAARWYDHAVPGFTTPDPLAEKRPNESPYAFCGGNPVNRSDQTGQEWYWNNDGDMPYWIEGDSDQPGYSNHNDTYQRDNGSSTDYFYDNNTSEHVLNDVTTSALSLSLYANSGIIGGNNNNFAPDRSTQMGDVGGGQNNGTGFLKNVSGIIQKYTSPTEDLIIGATGNQVGNILKNRGVYGKLLPETIIRTALANVNVSTELLQVTGTTLKVAGVGLGVVGVGMSAYEIGTGQKNLIGEGGLDLIMGGVGFIPGGGWIASGAYFGGKAILESTGNDFWNQ